MRGLAIEATRCDPRAVQQRYCRLTVSRSDGTGGTAEMHMDAMDVSGVPPVLPILQLIDDYRTEYEERQKKALVGALPRVPGQVGRVQWWQGFKVRQQGRDTCGTVRQRHRIADRGGKVTAAVTPATASVPDPARLRGRTGTCRPAVERCRAALLPPGVRAKRVRVIRGA
jgi:hypothetical protein